MGRWKEFRKCPHCEWNFATGEGEKACAWGDCAYLPQELNVFCDYCRFNFYTMEGNPPCSDPLACEHAIEPLAHVENYRWWRENQAASVR